MGNGTDIKRQGQPSLLARGSTMGPFSECSMTAVQAGQRAGCKKQETQNNNGAARLTHKFRTWYGCNVECPGGSR